MNKRKSNGNLSPTTKRQKARLLAREVLQEFKTKSERKQLELAERLALQHCLSAYFGKPEQENCNSSLLFLLSSEIPFSSLLQASCSAAQPCYFAEVTRLFQNIVNQLSRKQSPSRDSFPLTDLWIASPQALKSVVTPKVLSAWEKQDCKAICLVDPLFCENETYVCSKPLIIIHWRPFNDLKFRCPKIWSISFGPQGAISQRTEIEGTKINLPMWTPYATRFSHLCVRSKVKTESPIVFLTKKCQITTVYFHGPAVSNVTKTKVVFVEGDLDTTKIQWKWDCYEKTKPAVFLFRVLSFGN